MKTLTYKQRMAIEAKNKSKFLGVNPHLNEKPGIYVLVRDDGDFKYCYVGQAKKVLSRLAQHLSGWQHIDASLKKHGLYSDANPNGWKVFVVPCSVEDLDEEEQKYIKYYANNGYQMRNKTSGSQGKGKSQIADYKEPRGYRDGVAQGYKKAQKEVGHWFDLHLKVTTKSDKPNKNQEKALEKFNNFIGR